MVSSINQILHKRHFVGVAQVLLLEVLLQLAFSLRQVQMQQLQMAQFMRGHSSQPGCLQLRIQLQQKLRQVKVRLLQRITALLILCIIGYNQLMLLLKLISPLKLPQALLLLPVNTGMPRLELTQPPLLHQYHIMLQLPFTHQRNQDPLSWQHHWLPLL